MSWSNYLINKEVWKYTQLLTAYDYKTSQTKRDGLITTQVTAKNSIHPNEFGNILMGNTLAAVIQKFRH